MDIENLWGTNFFSEELVESTDNIRTIMDKQSKYLSDFTQEKVFAIFDVMNKSGAPITFMETLKNAIKGVDNLSVVQESVENFSSEGLIDATDIYSEKTYVFEIYTDSYRYRLFTMEMPPVYPVTMMIEEGVFGHIRSKLIRMGVHLDKNNSAVINDEETFTNVLGLVLQDKKVRYIVSELKKRALAEKDNDKQLTDKIVICEGRKDEIIIQAVAKKKNCKLRVVATEGKNNIPRVYEEIKQHYDSAKILLVVDSDGDEETVREWLINKMGERDYKLAIINNCIEDWFMPEVKNFSRLKLMQNIDSIIDDTDFDELKKKHKSFNDLIDFMKK